MIQTVIFDMDGVIVDTEPVHHFAYYQHFKALNISISPELYASFTGNSTKNIYEIIKNRFALQEDVATLVAAKRRFFNEAFEKKQDLCLLEGVEVLIKELHANKMQLVLASSAANGTIKKVFDRFDLHPYFTHTVSGEDFPKSKPHPAIFERAAFLANTPVSECVVIEDSTNGILAANAAHIFCIGYHSVHSKLQDYTNADVVIRHFKELNFEKILKIKDLKSNQF